VFQSLKLYLLPKFRKRVRVDCASHHAVFGQFRKTLMKDLAILREGNVPYVGKSDPAKPDDDRLPYLSRGEQIPKMVGAFGSMIEGKPWPKGVSETAWGKVAGDLKTLRSAFCHYSTHYGYYQEVLNEDFTGFEERFRKAQESVYAGFLRAGHKFGGSESKVSPMAELRELISALESQAGAVGGRLKRLQRMLIENRQLAERPPEIEALHRAVFLAIGILEYGEGDPTPRPDAAETLSGSESKALEYLKAAQASAEAYVGRVSDAKGGKSQWANLDLLRDGNLNAAYRAILDSKRLGFLHPKVQALIGMLEEEVKARGNTVLVSVGTKAAILRLTELLKSRGFRADYIFGGHSAADQKHRQEVIRRLQAGEIDVMIGTTVMDEGLDTCANTHIDYSVSANAIQKIQREGRAGRKEVGRCFTLIADHPDSGDLHRTANLSRSMAARVPSTVSPTDPEYLKLLERHRNDLAFPSKAKDRFWVGDLKSLLESEIAFQGKDSASPEEREKVKMVVYERFRVRQAEVRPVNGRGFALSMVFQDKTGLVEGRLWGFQTEKEANQFRDKLVANPFVAVAGKAGFWNGKAQLTLDHSKEGIDDRVCFMAPSDIDERDYGPDPLNRFGDKALEHLRGRHKALVEGIAETRLRIFRKNLFQKTEGLGDRYANFGAAEKRHHVYAHGLMEHSINLASLGRALADLYPFLRKDLLVLGGLLHDVGKTRTYTSESGRTQMKEGERVGESHMMAGTHLIETVSRLQAERPTEEELRTLFNFIESHHGDREDDMGSLQDMGSPEAFVLFFSDYLESKLNHLFQETHQPPEALDPPLVPDQVLRAFAEGRFDELSPKPEIQNLLKALREIHGCDLQDPKLPRILSVFDVFASAYPSLDRGEFLAQFFARFGTPASENFVSSESSLAHRLNTVFAKVPGLSPSLIEALMNGARFGFPKKVFHKNSDPTREGIRPTTLLLSHIAKWVEVMDFFEGISKTETLSPLSEQTRQKAKAIFNPR
jgi:3'-5' exoribonuclease